MSNMPTCSASPSTLPAKPVVAPPRQAARDRARPRRCSPERDTLEITFPRVEGYRVELPEERLTANFGPDSCPRSDAGAWSGRR